MTQVALIAFASSLAVLQMAHADNVRMCQTARVSGEKPEVHLADIATLEGEAAQALGQIVVAQLGEGETITLTVDQVRDVLSRAGANWGIVNLNGRTTTVRATTARVENLSKPVAMSPISLDPGVRAQVGEPAEVAEADATPPATAARWVSQNTVRGLIVTRLVGALSVDPSQLQIEFEHDDAGLLDRELTSGRFEVEPISRYDGPRVELIVREWSLDPRPTLAPTRHAVAVSLLMRCETVVSGDDINRGQMITDQHLSTRVAWLGPDRAALLAHRDSVIGRIATHRIHANEAIRQRDVEQEALLKRGDLVVVRCLVGGHVISFKAEARADAALGEEIAFRRIGERTDFLARIAGPGEAIVDLNQ